MVVSTSGFSRKGPRYNLASLLLSCCCYVLCERLRSNVKGCHAQMAPLKIATPCSVHDMQVAIFGRRACSNWLHNLSLCVNYKMWYKTSAILLITRYCFKWMERRISEGASR